MANRKEITPEAIKQQIKEFKKNGGKIEKIKRGKSGVIFIPKMKKEEVRKMNSNYKI